MPFRTRGALFASLGVAGLLTAVFDARLHTLGVGAGAVFFLLAASTLSKASRIAESLRPFVRQSVRVEVWGTPLPASGDTSFEIDSISAFGAGLLIHLRAGSASGRTLLKVAQPGSARIQDGRIAIENAAYVSWAGHRLKPAAGAAMPALVLLTRPRTPLASQRDKVAPWPQGVPLAGT